MKTHREIVLEAQRLEELGRRFADEQRRVIVDRPASANVSSVLFAFPESRFTGYSADDGATHTHRRLRRIEVEVVGNAVEYCLVQNESETTVTGAVVQEMGPVLMVRSDSAMDVLEEGYELAEEERLSEALSPFLDRIEADFADTVEPRLVEEIAAVVGAGELLPAARLHAKADIVRLLDGQLEPGEFITAAIARQWLRETESEIMQEQPCERMVIGQP